MVTKIGCEAIKEECLLSFKEVMSFVFTDESARDNYFSTNYPLLVNRNDTKTICMVGDTNVSFHAWNGADTPTSYIPSAWESLPLNQANSTGGIYYWGDAETSNSIRARVNFIEGSLTFERFINAAWTEIFKMSDSAILRTVLFSELIGEPVVPLGSLGLYNKRFIDGESGLEILRPVYKDPNGVKYLTIGSSYDGTVRVAQNLQSALADPQNVPLVYKRVLLEGDSVKIREALTLLSGEDRLDASKIKGLTPYQPATPEFIVLQLSSLSGESRIGFSAIKGLTSVTGAESANPVVIDPSFSHYFYSFIGSVSITQQLPDVTLFRPGAMLMICNGKTPNNTVTIDPHNLQTVNGQSTLVIPYAKNALIFAKPQTSEWCGIVISA